MGKTSKGAVWLDAQKTSPYDFFQYWRNIADDDVERVFRYLTFLPLDDIEELTRYKDERMNKAKERLAYELTRMVHGESEADSALKKAKGAFSGDSENMPQATIPGGMTQIADILVKVAKVPSKGEAKRLIAGGGISVDGQKVTDILACVTDSKLTNGFVLQKGKKNFYRVSVE